MDEVVQQDDICFKSFLDNIANGCLNMDDVDLICNHCLHNLSQVEKETFKNTIHLVPTWAEASGIVFDHLIGLGKPIARWRAA